MSITARDILKLLAAKHAGEVFVSECKDGPSQMGSFLKMDAWVMDRSWRHPCVSVYEIKVSRSDFLKDAKWHKYLAYCNLFYFVCPPGAIEPNELPSEAGLLVTSVNGTRLFCKKKAARRELVIPEDVFRYILMCRAGVSEQERDLDRCQRSKHEFWATWLVGKREYHELGRNASRAIRKTITTKIDEVETKQLALEKALAGYEPLRKNLRKLGIDPDFPVSEWSAEDAVRRFKNGGADQLLRLLGRIAEDAERSAKALRKSCVESNEDACRTT